MSTQAESRIARGVTAAIAALGGRAIKTHGSAYSRLGTPDVLGCIDGRMYALEVKTATGRASERQLFELRQWQDAGAVAAVVRGPSDVFRLAREGAAVDDGMEVAQSGAEGRGDDD